MMNDLLQYVGTKDYSELLQKSSGKILYPEVLKNLGPLFRTMLLFKLINENYSEARKNLISIGFEIFSNLSLFKYEDVTTLLDQIELGLSGRNFYGMMGKLIKEKTVCW
jgi:hypothetical protein